MSARLLALLCLLLAAPAHAVIHQRADGSLNTTPPADDPGFGHVGKMSGLTVVWIGEGWLLTANHVAMGPVEIGGVGYTPVPGSDVRLEPIGSAVYPPDLKLLRIDPWPPLPPLPIRQLPLVGGEPVVMIGKGTNRGAATSWNGYDGWQWGVGTAFRWGVNAVEALVPALRVKFTETDAIGMIFDDLPGSDEGIVSNGDSGGAVFVKNGGLWELAGILYAVEMHDEQPVDTALHGNVTWAADLSAYRDQIVAITGLWAPVIPALPLAGLPLLAGLLGVAGGALLRRRR